MIDFQIKVIAFFINANTCKLECIKMNGHLPYTFEAWGQSISK